MYEILLIDFYINELISINCFRNIYCSINFKNFFQNKISSKQYFLCMKNRSGKNTSLFFKN